MTPERLAGSLLAAVPGAAAEYAHGRITVDVPPQWWIATLTHARDALRCAFFDFLSAVDELDADPPGLRVVAHVYSISDRHRLLLRTLVPPGGSLPSATAVYPGADWHERETAEMFGLPFDGHPNPLPLLLPDGFAGHPLRKDFVLASRVARPWPGAVDPGQSVAELAPRRRRKLPPGVPDPDDWGPGAGS